MPCVEMRSDVRVGGGIPLIDVDAVQDAVQLEGEASQDPVQPGSVLARLNLSRIRWRYSRQLIGEDDASLHQVDVAVVLEGVRRPIPAVEAEPREAAGTADPLIVQVMNRVDRARVPELIAAAETGVEVGRKE